MLDTVVTGAGGGCTCNEEWSRLPRIAARTSVITMETDGPLLLKSIITISVEKGKDPL